MNQVLLNLFVGITLLMPVNIQSFLWNEANDLEAIEIEEHQTLISSSKIVNEIMSLIAKDILAPEEEQPVTTLETERAAAPETNETDLEEAAEAEEENPEPEPEPELTPEEEQELALLEWKESFPAYEETTTQTEFIQSIAPAAVLIANAQGVYPSVMIAQAGLESSWGQSGLAQDYNNLMGTKGSTEGKSVTVRTREDQNGESVYINAGFTVYDSWAHSLYHYGSLMKNGLSWNPEYYSGTWRENTDSYQDATAWLQGRYASDTSYASKLNQTIESFNLAQYDEIEPFEIELKESLGMIDIEM